MKRTIVPVSMDFGGAESVDIRLSKYNINKPINISMSNGACDSSDVCLSVSQALHLARELMAFARLVQEQEGQ